MISYKTYKLINESLGGPMALGLSPRSSIGVAGSRLAEMGLRPDEIDSEEDEMDGMGEEGPEVNVDGMDDDSEEMDSEDAPFPPEDMDDEMGMGDGDEDDMGGMGDGDEDDMAPGNELGHLPFNTSQMDDMASLAGLGGEDEMSDEDMDDMDDEEGMDDDMEDEMDDIDSMDMGRPQFGKFKNESKMCIKNMCDDDDDDDKDIKKDDLKFMKKDGENPFAKKGDKKDNPFAKKGDKKENPFAKKEDKDDDDDSSGIMKYKKKSKEEENDEYVGRRGHKEVKESFWDDFMKNAAGNVRKATLKEDAVIPPTNPNIGLGDVGNVGHAPQGRVGGVGSDDGSVKTDFFGYQSVSMPSFHDFIESKNVESKKKRLIESNCKTCLGSETCRKCKGDGFIGGDYDQQSCDNCNHTGWCPDCRDVYSHRDSVYKPYFQRFPGTHD